MQKKMDIVPFLRISDCTKNGVVAYGYSSNPQFASVVIDDEQGGYDATKYLVEHGHKKIGLIAGMYNNIHTAKRLAGYQKTLSDSNIPYDPKNVYYCDWNPHKAYEAAEMLVQEGVTAIFCMNDEMVAGVYNYLEKANLIPGKDIAVIGYDNREFASYIKPKITTVEIPLNQIGENAAKTMIQMIENADTYRYPYEPTPYCVLDRLAGSEYITKKNTLVDYGCGKGRISFLFNDSR